MRLDEQVAINVGHLYRIVDDYGPAIVDGWEVVRRVGIEPTTYGLRVHCSTN